MTHSSGDNYVELNGERVISHATDNHSWGSDGEYTIDVSDYGKGTIMVLGRSIQSSDAVAFTVPILE